MSNLRLRHYLSERYTGSQNDVYFASESCSLQDVLLEHIAGSDAVIGCVGWLTSKAVIDALAARPAGSSFIVDKGYVSKNAWVSARYSAFHRMISLGESVWDNTALHVLKPVTSVLDPVRILGFAGGAAGQASPMMHHKFAVMLKRQSGELVPSSVLLGSYNFSDNADRSLEFLNVSRDPVVIRAFLSEFAALYVLLSEPFNSQAPLPKPEWKPYVDGFADTVRWCWNWSATLELPDDPDDLEQMLVDISKTVRGTKASPDESSGDAYANSDWSARLVREFEESGRWGVEVTGSVVVAWDDELQPELDDLDCSGVIATGETPTEAVRSFLFELWHRDLLSSLD